MPMPPDDLNEFLAGKRNVIIAAIRKDGRPQMTPTWFVWDGARFLISMSKDSHKYRNLVRDPRCQLLIDDATGYKTVVLDGTAAFVDDLDEMMAIMRQVRGKHGMEAETDEAMRERLIRDNRVALVVTPDRPPSEWTSWV